jgi:hypothetical protein
MQNTAPNGPSKVDCRRQALRALAAAMLLSCCARAAEVIGPIEVTPLSQNVVLWNAGYLEHRVQVRNLSAAGAHRVRVVLPAESYGGGGGLSRLSREVLLRAGDAAIVSLPQPALQLSGGQQASLEIDGARHQKSFVIPSLSSTFEHYYGSTYMPVWVARRVNSDEVGNQLTAACDRLVTARHGRKPEVRLTRAESECAAWSPNWLAYSCFAAVVISADEWREAPAAVREALLRYVACGGIVVCLGTIEPPDVWLQPTRELIEGGQRIWQQGAGELRLHAAATPAAWSAAEADALARRLMDVTERSGAWDATTDSAAAHRDFPVMERFSNPAGGIFFMLLAFAVLIGPVLMIWLARRNRRIWLLWMVPAASGLACLLLLVYALIEGGVTPTRRSAALVLLDQPRHSGVAFGLTGLYAPLTPSGGLHFDAQSAVLPIERRQWRRNMPPREIDFTRDQHLVSGWLQPRVPTVFRVRRPFTARERLDIRATAGGGLEVVNGLGADIGALRIVTANGRHFAATGLVAGARAQLAPVAPPPPAGAVRSAQAAALLAGRRDWGAGLAALKPDGLRLEPGCYVAELGSCPFLDRGLEGRAHASERSVVLGRFEEAAATAGQEDR